MVTFKAAAVEVLRKARTPLTCRKIVQEAKKAGMLGATKSKNPVGTMSSIIHQSIKAASRSGGMSEFEKVGNKIRLAPRPPSRVLQTTPQTPVSPPPKNPELQPGKTSRRPVLPQDKPKLQGLGTQYVGKAGEHLVIAELLLRGFNANTMSVDEGIDVVATWHDLIYGFQVKTANLSQGTYSYNIPVKAFNKTKRPNVYYAFVLRNADRVDFLILPYDQVQKEIEQQNIGLSKKLRLYSVTVGKKDGKIYLGKQSNDVTYYRRRWPDPDNRG